jgi:hypothetical protein
MDRAGGRFFNNFVALEGTFNIDPFTSSSIATMEQQMFDASGGRLPNHAADVRRHVLLLRNNTGAV